MRDSDGSRVATTTVMHRLAASAGEGTSRLGPYHCMAREPRPQQHHPFQTKESATREIGPRTQRHSVACSIIALLLARCDRPHESLPANIAQQGSAFDVALPSRDSTRYLVARSSETGSLENVEKTTWR
jgi:hypothetical protein